MRILLVVSSIPSPEHRFAGAVTVVAFSAAAALRDHGHAVVVQPILDPSARSRLDAEELKDVEGLRRAGLEVEEPLWAPRWRPDTRWEIVRRALVPTTASFYPSVALADELRRRVAARGCDLLFYVWSPDALGAGSRAEVPVFNYQGNPDHVPALARLRNPRLFDIAVDTRRQRLAHRLELIGQRRRERTHLRLMRTCRWTANNSALDARYYADHGHPRSYYLQNMWPTAGGERSSGPPTDTGSRDVVGSIGNLRATGNTFGLHFLGREIVPALERILGERFTVSVYGQGSPHSQVAAALAHPRIRLRGWVEDIDGEIRRSGVFLLANNNHPDFRVGHTRVLHAWSLGACLVAHENIALAMPEIVHGENALLGGTGEEIAAHLAAAVTDRDLRARLGEAGRQTLLDHFTPNLVIGRALELIAE